MNVSSVSSLSDSSGPLEEGKTAHTAFGEPTAAAQAPFLAAPGCEILAGKWRSLAVLAVSTLFSMFLSLIPAAAFGLTIDKVIREHSMRNLVVISAVLFVAHFIETGMRIANDRLSSRLCRGASERLRNRVIGAFEAASLMALEQHSGPVVYRRVRSIDRIVAFYVEWYTSLLAVPLFLATISAVVMAENWILGVSMIALTALYGLIYWWMNRKLKAQYQQEAQERESSTKQMSELMSGLVTLRMAGRIGAFRQSMSQRQDQTVGRREQRLKRIALLQQLNSGYVRLAIIVLLSVGSLLVLDHRLSIGKLIAINLIFRRVLSEARNAVPLIQRFYQIGQDVERVRTLHDELGGGRGDGERPQAPEVPHFASIVVRDLTFRYPDSPYDVLRNVGFSIRAGEIVAVIGNSGAGKTSLLKLLCGLYAPSSGAIAFVGGEAGRHVRYGIATTADVLFSRSIRENITLGAQCDDEAVSEAARTAVADEFVSTLTHHYATELRDHGRNLSQGQKQRIVLARAFASGADLLLLDEPTGALDKDSEARLIERLVGLKGRKTVVMVTHRVAPALQADSIVMLEHGAVIEHGEVGRLLAEPDSRLSRWIAQTQHMEGVAA